MDATTRTVNVGYGDLSEQGGSLPLQVSCSMPSGADFPLGKTVVTCTATDGSGRTGSCSFTVTVTPVPTLAATTFLAFGDSLTAGENGLPLTQGIGPQFIDLPNSYPTYLKSDLSAAYPLGTFTVTNAGQSGELATEGVARLALLLPGEHWDALLLLEGINDLDVGVAAIPGMVDALRTDIRNARAAGVQYIFVSTLLPQKDGRRGRAALVSSVIVPANQQIAPMVTGEGAFLVDGFAAFSGHEGTYLGSDGLHPSPAGNEALANAFLAAIQAKIPTTVETGQSRLGLPAVPVR
ncbi:MAG: GDSL-type esterase/lipase family protein [Betaproteobacteria bacterium]